MFLWVVFAVVSGLLRKVLYLFQTLDFRLDLDGLFVWFACFTC